MKKSLIVIAMLIVGYMVIVKTPFVYNRTATYSKWLSRYMRIDAGENRDEPGFIFYDDKEAIMDDYVQKIDSALQDLVRYSTKSAGAVAPTNVTMAWREERTLYVINPAHYTDLPSEDHVATWTIGLQKIRDRVQMPITDKAFYDFALMYFDKLIVTFAARGDTATVPDATVTLMYGDDRDRVLGKQKL
jgi:hypothetical protein